MSKDRQGARFVLRVLRRLMEEGPLSVADLVDEAKGLKDDFVRRHLALLEEEIPGVGREGAWRRRWHYRRGEPEADEGFRLLTLMMTHTLLSSLRGSELDAKLSELIVAEKHRLGDAAPPPGDVSRMFFAKSRMIQPLGLEADIVDRLTKAMYETRQVIAEYEQFDGSTFWLTLAPYTLIFADDGVYVYGRCVASDLHRHVDTERLYSLERFRSMRLSKERFHYPARDQYAPEEVFRRCFGIFFPRDGEQMNPVDVVLSFAPRWRAFLARHRWYAGQCPPVEGSDGRILVTFRSIYLATDFARWIRGLGTDVQVVEPAELKTWVESGKDP